MKYPYPGETADGKFETKPEPWERQPGEPLDCYRWFQIYFTSPPPRRLTAVVLAAGLPPRSRLVARAASHWNWEERAAACDDQGAAASSLLRDWRNLLLNELAYVDCFKGLQDTGRALAAAAVDKMDRADLRRHLPTLVRRQRDLLSAITPRKEIKEAEVDDQELYWMIVERASEIRWEWDEPFLRAAYEMEIDESELDEINVDDLEDPNSDLSQRFEAALEKILAESKQDNNPDLPGKVIPWERQPGESADHYYLFRIFLSLMFLQSTWQVARMAGSGRETTLAKIAAKWTWQERAAAFEAHLAHRPLARFDLQHQLLLDKAYDLHLHGLLQSTKALEKAEIGRLDRATARRFLPLLVSRQRSLLQQVSRADAAFDRKALNERRDVRLAVLVEEKAFQQATDDWHESQKFLEKVYGKPTAADDEKE